MKDSNGLHDYESMNAKRGTVQVTGPCKIVRDSHNRITALSPLFPQFNSIDKILLHIGRVKNIFFIYSPTKLNKDDAESMLWLIAPYSPYTANTITTTGCRLCQDDVIKLGKCNFVVKDIVTKRGSSKALASPAKSLDNLDTIASPLHIRTNDNYNTTAELEGNNKPDIILPSDAPRCRICLGEVVTNPQNPFIHTPCLCTGSVGTVHLECLKSWLQSKVEERKNVNSVTYTLASFTCEVCKKKFPGMFLHSDCLEPFIEKIGLGAINFAKPFSRYIQLESDIATTGGIKSMSLFCY